MFGKSPFGVAPFGAMDEPVASNADFVDSTVTFEGKADFVVMSNNPLEKILGKGDRKIAFAAIVKPWQLVKV